MKRLSRFNKILIAVGVVAASGGASLGITSLVSANNASSPDVAAEVTAVAAVDSADDVSVASGSVSSSADDSANTTNDETVETKEAHVGKRGLHSPAMAELFGMTVDELHEALHSGKSLATIAEEKNVALSQVTDLMIAEFSAHLDEEVASGEHTREEADAKLAEFTANVEEMVTKTRPARGEMGPRGEGGPRGHHGHGGLGGPRA